jgi:hypothetical protein
MDLYASLHFFKFLCLFMIKENEKRTVQACHSILSVLDWIGCSVAMLFQISIKKIYQDIWGLNFWLIE